MVIFHILLYAVEGPKNDDLGLKQGVPTQDPIFDNFGQKCKISSNLSNPISLNDPMKHTFNNQFKSTDPFPNINETHSNLTKETQIHENRRKSPKMSKIVKNRQKSSKITKNDQKSKNGPKTGGFKGFGKIAILAPYGAKPKWTQKSKKHRFFTFFYRVPWDPQNRSKSTKIDKNDQI